MRKVLTMLLFLMAPLLAEESPGKAKDEIEKKIEEILGELEGLEAGLRAEIEVRLRRMLEKVEEIGTDGLVIGSPDVDHDVRVIIAGGLGSESITGTADGTSYALKSLGGGKYELEATQDDGTKITDKGTMKELSERYDFLRGGGFAFRMPVATGVGIPGFVRRWKPRDSQKPTVIGVMVKPVSDTLRFHLELPAGAGLVVGNVFPGSRGMELGLKQHDILLRIDDEVIDSPEQLAKLKGNQGTLTFIRRGKQKTLDLSKVGKVKAEGPEAPK